MKKSTRKSTKSSKSKKKKKDYNTFLSEELIKTLIELNNQLKQETIERKRKEALKKSINQKIDDIIQK